MKKFLTIIVLVLSISFTSAQTNSDLTVQELEVLQQKAVENENYSLAANYKKAIILKADIAKNVEAGDYSNAAKLKGELNALDLDTISSEVKEKATETEEAVEEKENTDDYGAYGANTSDNSASSSSDFSSEDPYVRDREILNKGFFIDGIIGGGLFETAFSSQPYFSLNMRMGSKWYFGLNYKYRPGIQVSWIRVGIGVAPDGAGDIFLPINLYPVNVGYSSILNFNGKTGMEFNLEVGPGVVIVPTHDIITVGFNVSPEVKFRVKKFAVGVNVSVLNGYDVSNDIWETITMFGVTLGRKK